MKLPDNHGTDYASRNATLRRLGYKTYSAYLKSPMWRQIRARVFAEKGRGCYLCGSRATEAHHNRYRESDLTGCTIKHIHPLCRGCHEGIEFKNGEKNELWAARKAYIRRRSAFRGPMAAKTPPSPNKVPCDKEVVRQRRLERRKLALAGRAARTD